MMEVPWRDVLDDIEDALSDYDCDIHYDGATEDYKGNVLCDFIVTFNDPDSIADWNEIIDDLYDYDDEDGWGWEIESNFPELIIGVVFEPGFDL